MKKCKMALWLNKIKNLVWGLVFFFCLQITPVVADDQADLDAAIAVAYEQKDSAGVLKIIQTLAQNGNVKAQFTLGAIYVVGEGVKQDYAEALKWYKLAALQGDAQSQFNVGLMYDKGDGVKQDSVEAVKWYTLSAAQGHAKAQYNLGFMYEKGKGVKQNFAEAVKWYELVAAQNTNIQAKEKAQKALELLAAQGVH